MWFLGIQNLETTYDLFGMVQILGETGFFFTIVRSNHSVEKLELEKNNRLALPKLPWLDLGDGDKGVQILHGGG
jgi:hypothetical protein